MGTPSAGLLLIPGTQLAISGGRQSVLYVVDRDNMGGITNTIQSRSLIGGEIHGGPVWWGTAFYQITYP